MSVHEGVGCRRVDARVFRISFTGELSFEINVPWHRGRACVGGADGSGRCDHGITPYGTEAMHVLRAERGFIIVGQETDGTTTPRDLGMDWIVSKKKADFLGKRAWSRADTAREGPQAARRHPHRRPEHRAARGHAARGEAGDAHRCR